MQEERVGTDIEARIEQAGTTFNAVLNILYSSCIHNRSSLCSYVDL